MTSSSAPTVKQQLHALIDLLPESEMETARRVLEGLHATAASQRYTLEDAPVDDEPETEEERAAVAEARADLAAGRVHSHEELKRELGLA
ncbi:MAG: hypothetical protein KY464_08460 [Gemmatimonadetes bacterium]|nr:hypothetical protein [Gemmatimonadota bacterium]